MLCLECHSFTKRTYCDPDFKTPEEYEKERWQVRGGEAGLGLIRCFGAGCLAPGCRRPGPTNVQTRRACMTPVAAALDAGQNSAACSNPVAAGARQDGEERPCGVMARNTWGEDIQSHFPLMQWKRGGGPLLNRMDDGRGAVDGWGQGSWADPGKWRFSREAGRMLASDHTACASRPWALPRPPKNGNRHHMSQPRRVNSDEIS